MSKTAKKPRLAPHAGRKAMMEERKRLETLADVMDKAGQTKSATEARNKALELKERIRAMFNYDQSPRRK